MKRRFSDEDLFSIRTFISVQFVAERLLDIPCKVVEGIFRFLCPKCNEFQTAINPKNNLSRCFRCKENFNTIDLVMRVREVPFVEAVKVLQPYVKQQSVAATQVFGTKSRVHPECANQGIS